MSQAGDTTTILTQEVVLALLDYNPATGSLIWRQRDRKWFSSDGEWESWNTRYASKRAIATPHPKGYLQGYVLANMCLAHRVIWLMQTGNWPDNQIDHENHDQADNRWCNLREATNQENHRNRPINRNNTSGHTGVYATINGTFSAIIKVNYSAIHLGVFKTEKEAIEARKAAELFYGFSPKHGLARRKTIS